MSLKEYQESHHTVDGRNPAPVENSGLSHYFYRISTHPVGGAEFLPPCVLPAGSQSNLTKVLSRAVMLVPERVTSTGQAPAKSGMASTKRGWGSSFMFYHLVISHIWKITIW